MSDTLSVCCIANVPGPFLMAALAPFREIADEIVIAAGGNVSAADLACYSEIADRLFAIEFDYLERHLAWLHAECRGAWILRLDGDEIPSREMVEAVSTMKSGTPVNGVFFARRNLFPTIASYISQEPWYPDFQLRMVRNDGALRFSGLLHSSAERSLPARLVEAPIYHLPFVLADGAARQARAARYEFQRPGLVAPTGLPAFQLELPEAVAPLRTAAVPDRDRREIEAVLAASTSASPFRVTEAVHRTLADTDAHWAGRSLPDSAYRASIDVAGESVPFGPAERRPCYFRVRNEGTELWGWDPSVGPFLHVVHRLSDGAGMPVDEWRPSFFTEEVGPGSTTIVPGHVDAPQKPGRYLLQVRLRHAPDRLFGSTAEVPLVVRPGGAWGTGSSLCL
jgi:hypothetical protein